MRVEVGSVDATSGTMRAVVDEADPLRQEQLTHDLRHALASITGSDVSVEESSTPGTSGPSATTKGGSGDVALWLAVAATAKTVPPVVVAAIQAWCERDRHRKVRIEVGDLSVEVSGMDDEELRAQARELVASRLGAATSTDT
jgi:hypothetical protein